MNLLRYWPLAILLLGLAGCGGSTTESTSDGKSAAELIELGNQALARSELDQALDDFSKAVEAQADSALARERRATVFVLMKRFDQVLADCDEALKIDGKMAAAYFARGMAEKGLGETGKALDDFTKAIDNGLEGVDVFAGRGALYHSLAKASAKPDEAAQFREKALKDFDRAVKLAVKLDPRQAGIRLQRALVRLDIGYDYEGAVADCDAALEIDPNLAAAHVARARGECELSENDHAIIDCDSAIHLDENLIEAYVIRAKARLENASEMRTEAEVKECEQAAADCRKAIDLSNKFKGDAEGMKHARTMRGMAHELRGSIYQDLGAAQSALDEYGEALSLDPYLVSALLRRAVTRSTEVDYAGALSDCNTAISIDSARPEAYSGRGWVYLMKLEYPKAIEDFTQAVQLDPKCAKAYGGRAIVYSVMATAEFKNAKTASTAAEQAACQERGQEFRQKAIDDATKAIDANHHLARAYLTRALAYANQQIPSKALADFNAAIREDPKMVKAYQNRGVLHFKQFHLDLAIQDFETASRLQPENALFDYRLYQCYKMKPDPITAEKYLEQMKEKLKKRTRSLEDSIIDSENFLKPKKAEEIPPDAEVQPLDKAKNDLKKKLGATVEK